MDGLERYRELINKLNSLLDDPHPGLWSWNMMFSKVMEELVSLWQNKNAEQSEKNENITQKE